MKGQRKIPYESILLAAIVSVIWTLACAFKGIYPFGDYVLSVGDMREQSIPVYTFLWDVMHGQKSLFFDWDIGLGNNMSGVVSHFTLLSSFNLFLFLVKRSAIETSMFSFFLCKIIAIALGVRFVFRKWFPELDTCLLLAFCILYTFCPFLVEYYRVPSWYDIAFVFPFVMYYYFELMRGRGRGIGYILSLAAFGVMTFQHTYMLAILLLLMTGGLLVIDRERYSGSVLRFIGASVAAAMLSACVLLPGTLQIMTAGRLGGKFDLVEILESVYIFFPAKWSKLVNLGIPFGMILCGCRKNWKKKDFLWLIYVDLLLLLPIALESTNMLWHGGPYEGYTMRFAYMLAFWVLVSGMYCYRESGVMCGGSAQKCQSDKSAAQTDGRRIVFIWTRGKLGKCVTCLWVVVLFALGAALYYMAIIHSTAISLIVLVVILSMLAGAGMFHVKEAVYVKGMLAAAAAVSIAILCDNIIDQYHIDDSGVYLYNTMRDTEMETDRPVLDRIKSLNIVSQNYPQLLNRSAIGNYTASEAYEQIRSVTDMGYALIGNRMSDWGGTVFSDAILGTKEVLTFGETEVDAALYTEKAHKADYQIYDCNDIYEEGILLREDFDMTVKGEDNPFLLQNEMAESILGERIFTLYETRTDTIEIPIGEESILYAYVPGEVTPVVTVQSITVTDAETGNISQKIFPSGWDNGIINFGRYQDTELYIQVEKVKDIDTMYFAVFPLAEFRQHQPVYAKNFQYTASGCSLKAQLTGAAEGQRLFLPVYNDAGWECKVNGNPVETETYLTGGMCIPLVGGDNVISLRYWPPGMKTGIMCSLLGLVLCAVFYRLSTDKTAVTDRSEQLIHQVRSRGKCRNVNRTAGYLVLGVWGALMVLFYVLPVIFLVKFVVQRILP